MSSLELARRYAKVFEKLPSKAIEELLEYEQPIAQAGFEPFFFAPQIKRSEKMKVIESAFGNTLSKDALGFILLLFSKKRFPLFPKILETYRAAKSESISVTIITAVPMNASAREKWKMKLENTFKKKIEITEKIDANLIGGAILIVGNKMLDASIRDRLFHIKKDLLTCA